jgi:hypothetical protein
MADFIKLAQASPIAPGAKLTIEEARALSIERREAILRGKAAQRAAAAAAAKAAERAKQSPIEEKRNPGGPRSFIQGPSKRALETTTKR